MPAHRIIQQQELILSLNSLTESYEHELKKATDAVTRTNKAAEMERRRKIELADELVAHIRQIENNLKSGESSMQEGSSRVAIATTGVNLAFQLAVCQSVAEDNSPKLISFRNKIPIIITASIIAGFFELILIPNSIANVSSTTYCGNTHVVTF